MVSKRPLAEKISRIHLCWLLPGVAVAWIAFLFWDPKAAVRLTYEDHFIQWAQFVLLFLAAIYFLRIALAYNRHDHTRLVRNVFFVFFVSTLILAMEEISWGQQIFGFETPEFVEKFNKQDETNLHNAIYFQRFRHWLVILTGAVGVFLALLGSHHSKHLKENRFDFFFPPKFFICTFSVILLSGVLVEAATVYKYFFPSDFAEIFRICCGRFIEIGELGIALAALFYGALKHKDLTDRSTP
ncbi:hypothetical protein ACFLU6_11750 [Acidobacteriota bacterium]